MFRGRRTWRAVESIPCSNVKLAVEPILYGNEVNYLPLKPWLADDESFTREVGQAASPLLQLEFGSWRLPVMLSGAAILQ